MDSAGIGLIIGRYKQTKMYGGELKIQNVSPKLKRILEMSGIEKIVKVEEKQLVS
jgi:stage II sporulation protein AA (anti-sigma F factor antagonist)